MGLYLVALSKDGRLSARLQNDTNSEVSRMVEKGWETESHIQEEEVRKELRGHEKCYCMFHQ